MLAFYFDCSPLFFVARLGLFFHIRSSWNDWWSPGLANAYCGGSCFVDYLSSPSPSHGRARRRPRSAGWMCVKQRRSPSTDEDGDSDDALVSSAVAELILYVRAKLPQLQPFPHPANILLLKNWTPLEQFMTVRDAAVHRPPALTADWR